jgi:hypothetical protein
MTRRGLLLAALFARNDRLVMAGIAFKIVRGRTSPHRYLHIHGDESTARQVFMETIAARGGIGLDIISETRIVPILGGSIDPNRMFSREGAVRSLKRLNKDWSEAQIEAAADLLDRERGKFLKVITPPQGGRIVALHNNANGYSVEAEVAASDKASLKDAKNPHEFFLATDPRDYEKLAALPVNVVLQQKPAAEDDGSLSRLAAKLGIRYINLECAIGKLDRQRELLGWLEKEIAE